jgi:lipoprotein NlpI
VLAQQEDMTKRIPRIPAISLCALCLYVLLLPIASAAEATAQAPSSNALREVAVDPSAFIRGAAMPPWFRREVRLPESTSHDPVVMRFADSHFRVDATPSVLYHRAILVNESSALVEIGQYPIAFQPDYQQLQLHWLKVHRGGEIIDKLDGASVRFYHAERSVSQGIYTGSITAVVIPQDIRAGDTLEIIYSIIGQNPVFAGRFMDAAAWETTVPVIKRRVTLDLPRGRSVRHRIVGAGNTPTAVESDWGDRHLVRYEAENLAAVDLEAMIPPDVQAQSWVQFSEFRDWKDVGQWAAGLFSAGNARDFPMPDLGKAAGKADLLMRALGFVQDNIRYLSIAIGENSHRPYAPADVLARRYGDCKDKTQLLVAMLRRLGIEADPVLVSSQSRKGFGELLPSPALFDHAIVRAIVDGKSYFIDPTLQYQASRLESLGLYLPGAEVFVVRDGVRALEFMPTRHADRESTARRLEKVTVQDMDQPADMAVELIYRAEDAEAARRAMNALSPAQLRKSYEGLLDRRYPQAEFVGEPQITDDREKNLLTIRLRYRIPKFFEKQDQRWTLRYEASNIADSLPSPNNAKRRFPLFVAAYPWAASYRLEITLPEAYDANYKPEQRKLQTEAFELDEHLKFKGRQLDLEVNLELTRDRIAAAGTPQFLADLRTANGYFRGSLSVSDRDLRKASAAAVPLKELSRQRLEQALRSSASAIAAAKTGGRETAGARCEHALAAAYLDQPDVAREDAEAAVAEQPASPDILGCRGTVSFIVGDFESSIRDLSRALALGQDETENYFQRGLAHYYAGHWRKAAEDFAAYGRRSKEERIQARASIWQALARHQDGAAIPPRDPRIKAWPAAALEVFDHKASAEDVIEDLSRSERGVQLEEATAEAYFYFSRHFAASNRAKSQAYLRRSVDLGALYSLVQVAARHEMKRLDSMRNPPADHGQRP